MNRTANIARVGSIYSNMEHIKEVYSNHAKLIQEILLKTKMIDDLSSEISTLKGKETASPDELKSLQTELDTLKDTMKEIDNLKNEITAIKSEDQSEIKQELLDALTKSIPKFTEEVEEKSEDSSSAPPAQHDYPFIIPKATDGMDGMEINGVEVFPTSKGDQLLCSIKTDYGGLAVDKDGSEDRWIVERNVDDTLKFHFNSEEETPLSVNRDGISTPKLTLNDKSVTSIATAINADTISSKTIPTTKALVDFVNANVIKANVEAAISPAAPVTTRETTNVPHLPSCDISTIDTPDGKSLLISNSSSSISFKNSGSVVTLKPSLTDGLVVGDKFKLTNDSGMLCVLKDGSLDDDTIEGRYVEYTGTVLELDDILILEVQVLKDVVSSVTCGIIGKDLKNQTTYTHQNRVYKLPLANEQGQKYHFVTIFNSGIHYVKTHPGEFAKGTLLVPSKEGYAIRGTDNLANFCVSHVIPRAKVVGIIDDKVVAMLV